MLGTVYARGQGYPLVGFHAIRHMMVQALVASGAFLSFLVTAYGVIWRVTQRA